MSIKLYTLFTITLLAFSSATTATDLSKLESELDVNPVESCSDGIELYREGDLKGAVELINLCRDELMQMSEQLAAAAFLDEIMGFTGAKLRQQNAMGFSQIERKYSAGDQGIEVTLSGGQAASMMQSIIGISGRKTRIGKHSGFIIAQNDEVTVYVPLDELALMFKSRTVDQKLLKKFAKEFLKGFAN